MVYLKKIYLLPWTIWCGLSFLACTGVAFLIIFLLLLTGSKKAYVFAHHIPTYCARVISYLWLTFVKVKGLENIDTKAQYIFVGNHRSMLDAIISTGYIPNAKKFIGKAEILSYPFIGWILKKLYIPVQRKSKESRKETMKLFYEKMNEGMSMCVFAEGTCNTTDKPLMEFKDGAFEVSYDTNIPIVPFVIKGADNLWHRDVWLIRPGKVELVFLPPVSDVQKNYKDAEYLKTDIYNQILKEYLDK